MIDTLGPVALSILGLALSVSALFRQGLAGSLKALIEKLILH